MCKIWYNNGIEEHYYKQDEQPIGYIQGRLKRKKKVDDLLKNISKEELIEFYINQNHTFIETLENFKIERNGLLNQLLKIYGIKKDYKSRVKNNKYKRTHEESLNIGKKSGETQKINWENKTEVEKQKWAEKQINSHHETEYINKMSEKSKKYWENYKKNNPEEFNNLNNRRSISCKSTWEQKGNEIKSKRNNTIKENRKNRFCRTVAEQNFYNKLKQLYNDIVYDSIIDERYPYCVDFYIPSKDLFIEYNGHPSHGKIPYDGKNTYQLYGNWLQTYTIRDVEKYKCAKQNKLNYIRLYPNVSIEENLKINGDKYIEIIKLLN